MCSMRIGKKTGFVLVAIAILYFLWILAVSLHEGEYLLKDTDFIFSLVEWTAIGIVLYLLIIVIFCFLCLIPARKSQKKEEFKLVEGKKNQVVCGNCKTIFSFHDNGERPLEIRCPNCESEGMLKGKKLSAKKHIISCSHCGNIFEIFEWGTRPFEYECPECHQRDSLP